MTEEKNALKAKLLAFANKSQKPASGTTGGSTGAPRQPNKEVKELQQKMEDLLKQFSVLKAEFDASKTAPENDIFNLKVQLTQKDEVLHMLKRNLDRLLSRHGKQMEMYPNSATTADIKLFEKLIQVWNNG